MAFITPALKSSQVKRRSLQGWRLLLVMMLGLVSMVSFSSAYAADFSISDIRTEIKEGVYLLNADIDYRFSDEALQALSNGVPLTVQLTLEINRMRNWWLDDEIATLEQHYSLQYHALSHQYLLRNLNSGAFYSLPHYRAAVEAMGRLRDLPLLDSKLIMPDQRYEVSMQVELDIEALPSPLRPVAYITPSWRLRSDWYSWYLKP